jgi:hypothetical protein
MSAAKERSFRSFLRANYLTQLNRRRQPADYSSSPTTTGVNKTESTLPRDRFKTLNS